MIYILQYKGISLPSRWVQLATWGEYSHSAIANYDGTLVEACEGIGVTHSMSPWEKHREGTVIDIYEISTSLVTNPHIHYHEIWKEALKHVGEEYDYISLIGFLPLLRYFWTDTPDKWFCSHLVAHCCKKEGIPLFSATTPLYKLSPTVLPWTPILQLAGTMRSEKEWDIFLDKKR